MMAWLGIVVMLLALIGIPLGLPGLWIMIGVAAIAAIAGEVSLVTLLACVILAVAAELVEFFLLRKLTKQYGGSRKAFWGALGGGFVGVLVGAPIPIIGSIIAGMIGAFAGAALVTYAETKQVDSAHRVGWGAVIGRMLTAVAKTAAGIAILAIAAAALLR
jgi:uncharacterized protein YqgC (DUF456 family)